jgi:predicted RNA-binding Zn ribbon-like protein
MEVNNSTRRKPPRFDLVAGALCLDFVNTLDNRPSGKPKELLKSYIDLARFGEDTGILDSTQVDWLFEHSYTLPQEAERALRAGIELRETIYAICSAIIQKRAVPPKALAQLNGFVQDAALHSWMVEINGRFEWRFDNTSPFDAVLWPIARSAVDLLASDLLPFVRACASKTCQWFFVDTSKNHRRRWCKMQLCGNRTKVKNFYRRQGKSVASTE